MTTTNGSPRSDVDKAKRAVERAERLLSTRLHEAGVAGDRTVEEALSIARPLVVGAVAVAGVVWLVSLFRRPRRRPLFESASPRPSIMKEALRTVTLSLAATAARRVSEHFLLPKETAESSPAERAIPPHHPTTARP